MIVIQNIGKKYEEGCDIYTAYNGSMTTSYHFIWEILLHTNFDYLRNPLPNVIKALPALEGKF